MKTEIKIRKKCACGCMKITNPGNKWVWGQIGGERRVTKIYEKIEAEKKGEDGAK